MNNQIATTTQTGMQVQQQQNPLLYPPIRSHTDEDIFQIILVNLVRSYTDLGLEQPTENTVEYMANTLADSIPKRFPSIRLHEVPIAFSLGIRGKFGKFYGLSVVAFENFIDSYLSLESREVFARELPKIEEKTEPDDLTKFQVAKFNACQALQKKNAGSDVSLIALAVYTFLDGLKLINFSIEEKYDFLNDARTQIVEELKSKKVVAKDALERKQINTKIARFSSLVDDAVNVDQDEKHQIVNRAKKLALEAFLADCILNGIDLGELIESKRELFLEQCRK